MHYHKLVSEAPESSEYSLVYSYFAVGILLLVAAFILVPRMVG